MNGGLYKNISTIWGKCNLSDAPVVCMEMSPAETDVFKNRRRQQAVVNIDSGDVTSVNVQGQQDEEQRKAELDAV